MKVGVLELFNICIRPFSSHTGGPMTAASIFFPDTSVMVDRCNLQPKEIYHA